MKSAKRILAMLLVLVMMTGMLSAFAAAPGDFADFPHGTWSEAAMTAAVGNGLLQGKGVNTIAPKDYLTRAEAATIINRAFGATVTKDISQFTDVTPGQWYYVEMQKAANMETIVGTSSTTMDPLGYITRESMMTVLARALVLSDSDTSSLSKFADGASVSSWAAPYVAAMTRLGYVNGDGNGYINPQAYITREEFAQIMHNTIKTYITASGTVKDVTYNTTLIRTPGVTLENVVINGDLIIGDGVGAGDVNLTNVKVSGRILFRGGEGKVTLKKTTVGEYIVVHDVNGTVNFNNYETEMVFDDHLQNTPATFLKKPGSTVGGGVSRKSYTVNVYLMKLDGTYSDTPDDTDTVSAKSGATITYNTGKTGFTLDTAKGNLTGTNNGSLVIDAYYKRNTYTVKYGGVPSSIEVYYGSQPLSGDASKGSSPKLIAFLEDAVKDALKDGFTLTFNTKPDGTGEEITADTVVDENGLDIYAIFTPFAKLGFVLKESADEKIVMNVTLDKMPYGIDKITSIAFDYTHLTGGQPSKLVWDKADSNIGGTLVAEDGKISWTGGEITSIPDGGMVLFTITFTKNKEDKDDTVIFDFDKNSVSVKDGETKATAISLVKAEITLSGKQKFTIIYDGNTYVAWFDAKTNTGDTYGNAKLQKNDGTIDETVKLSDVLAGYSVPGGYTHDGFKNKATGAKIDLNTVVKESITIVPNNTAIPYSVTYDAMGGTADGQPTKVEEDVFTVEAAYTLSTFQMVKGSDTFLGWYMKGDTKKKIITEIPKGTIGDVTVCADWKPDEKDKYEIIFDGKKYIGTEDKTLGTALLENGTSEDTLAKAMAAYKAPDGYKHDGTSFVDGEGNPVTADKTVIKGKMDIEPVLELIKYDVIYNANDGYFEVGGQQVNTVTADKVLDIEHAYTLDTTLKPKRDNHVFEGWYMQGDTSKTLITKIGTGYTKDVTVLARWAEYYTITYKGVEYYAYAGDKIGDAKAADGQTTLASVLNNYTVPDGYTHDGFKNNATGAKVDYLNDDAATMELVPNDTLIKYDVIYDANGGKIDGQDIKTEADKFDILTPYTLNTEIKPVREGYTFIGWYMDATTEKIITAIPTGLTADVTVYAKWDKNPTLSFVYDSENSNDTTVYVDVVLNKIPAVLTDLAAVTIYYDYAPDVIKYVKTVSSFSGFNATDGAIAWNAMYDGSLWNYITADSLASKNGVLFTLEFSKNKEQGGTVDFTFGKTELASSEYKTAVLDIDYKTEDTQIPLDGKFVITYDGVKYYVEANAELNTAEAEDGTKLSTVLKAYEPEDGYKNLGFKNKDTGAKIELTDKVTTSFEIEPVDEAIQYDVIYDANGGTADGKATIKDEKAFTVEAAYTLKSFTMENGTDVFDGWYMNTETEEIITQIPAGTIGPVTVYAKWSPGEEPTTTYNVTFYEGTKTKKGSYPVISGHTVVQDGINVDTILPPAEYEMEYGYTDSDGKAHEIAPELWYQVDGEWELFDPATVKIVKDTDVHLLTRFATIYYDTDIKIKGVKVPRIELSVAYDSNTDLIKSGLDLLAAMGDVLESTLYDVENYGGVDIFQTALDKAAKTGLIDKNGNLLNPNVPVPLHKLITEDLIMKEIDRYIDANINNEDFIADILRNDTVVDMLLGDDEIRKKVLGDEDMRKKLLTDTVIKTMIQKQEVIDYIIHNETFKKKFIDSDETFEYILGDLKELLDNKDYHEMIIDACVEFVVDVYFREDGDSEKVNAPELVDYIDEVLDSDDVIKDIEGNIDRDHFKEQIKGLIKDLLKPENAATKNKIYEEIRKSDSFKQSIIDVAINNSAIKATIMEDVRTDLASANSKYKDTVITAVRTEFDKPGSELKDNIVAAVKTDLNKGSASTLRATVAQAVKDDLAKDNDGDDLTSSTLKPLIVSTVNDDLAKDKDNDDTTNSVLKGAIVSAVSKDFEKGTESTLKSTIEDTVKTEIQTAGSDLRDTILDSAATGSLAATVKAYAQDNDDIRDSVKNNADVKTSVKAEAKTWLTDSDNLNTVKADLKTAVVGNKDALSIAILNSGYEITAGTPISKADADDLAGKYLGLNGESLDSGVKAEIDDAIDSFFGDDNNVKLIAVLEDNDNFNTIYNTAYDDIFDKLYADSTVFDKAYATYIGGASGRTNLEDAFDKYISVPDNLENAIDTFVNNSDNLKDAIDVYISNTSDLSAAIDAYLELSDDLTDAIDLYIDNASSDDIEKAINTYIEDDDNLIKAINTYIAKPTDSTQPDKLEEVFDIFTADKANLLTAFDAYIGDGKNGDNTNLDKAFAEFTGDPTALETFYNTYLGNNAQDPALFNKLFEEYYHTHVHDVAKEAYKDEDLNELVMSYVRKYTDEMVVKYANGDLAEDEDHKDLAATIDKLMADEFPKVIREQYYMEGSTIKTTVDSLIETEGTKLIKQYADDKITDPATIDFIKKTIDDNIGIIVDDYVAGTLKADIKALVDAEIDAYMQRLIDDYINNVGDARETLGELIPTYAKDAVDTLKATDAFKNTIKDFTSGNGVRVNKDNEMFINILVEFIDKYDYDSLMKEFAPAKLKTIVDKVGADVARKYVNTLLDTFVADINKALGDLEANNGEGEYKFSTSPRVRVYYMQDFVVDYYNKGMPKIVNKLNSKELIASNPYAQRLLDKNWITELLDFDATAVSEEMSGYSLKKGGLNDRYDSPIMTYYDIVLENVVLLHDAVMWYGTEYSEGTIEAKLDAASALIATYANKANDVIMHYINTGELPKGYTPYEIADKILNKVLGVNDKIDDAYDKIEDKYYENEDRILELIQKAKDFYVENLNRDYTDIIDLANLTVYADGEAYPVYQILLEMSEENKAFNIDTAATAVFDSDNYHGINKVENAMSKVKSKLEQYKVKDLPTYVGRFMRDAYRATLDAREIKGHSTGNHTVEAQRYLK